MPCHGARRFLSARAPSHQTSVITCRLAGGLKKGEPKITARINRSPCGRGDADGKMDITVVPSSDDQSGLARHTGVHGRLTKAHAVGPVLRRGRNAANHITGVDIFESQLCPALAKIVLDSSLEENADVSKTLVPRRIRPRSFDQVLSGAFSNNHHRVIALDYSLSELLEKAVITLQREGVLPG